MSLQTEVVKLSALYHRRADLDTERAQVWEDPMTGELYAYRKGEDSIVRRKDGQGSIRRNVGGIV